MLPLAWKLKLQISFSCVYSHVFFMILSLPSSLQWFTQNQNLTLIRMEKPLASFPQDWAVSLSIAYTNCHDIARKRCLFLGSIIPEFWWYNILHYVETKYEARRMLFIASSSEDMRRFLKQNSEAQCINEQVWTHETKSRLNYLQKILDPHAHDFSKSWQFQYTSPPVLQIALCTKVWRECLSSQTLKDMILAVPAISWHTSQRILSFPFEKRDMQKQSGLLLLMNWKYCKLNLLGSHMHEESVIITLLRNE